MVRYILKRLLQLVVVLLGVTFLTFMITQATPSDAAEMKYVSMGMMPSTELLEKTREEMGLNDPVLIQYGRWLGNVLHGIVIFGLLGLYLIGKLKFQVDAIGGDLNKPMPVACIMLGLCSLADA